MMDHISRVPVERAVEVRPKQSQQHDKWILLSALTEAAETYGLNHRTISVLRALLSFFPERVLPDEPRSAIVYPSNDTLSRRLNGMPESTLRRHLAELTKSGLITRHDSPNRKRFAKRRGLAYGFDLSPLAQMAEDIHLLASEARIAREALAALRDRLATTRARLLESGDMSADDPLMEETRRVLRRKPDETVIRELLATLEALLNTPLPQAPTDTDLSGCDGQIERHIQVTNKNKLVLDARDSKNLLDITLTEVLENCTEYRAYFPDTPPTWHGLFKAAVSLSQMLGISSTMLNKALGQLGHERTATTLLCMLERSAKLRAPNAYLSELVARAALGTFNLNAMLKAVGRAKLSADNFSAAV